MRQKRRQPHTQSKAHTPEGKVEVRSVSCVSSDMARRGMDSTKAACGWREEEEGGVGLGTLADPGECTLTPVRSHDHVQASALRRISPAGAAINSVAARQRRHHLSRRTPGRAWPPAR